MQQNQSLIAVIVAAGSGSRVGGALPKQFANYRGEPMLRHSAKALKDSGKFDRIVLVVGEGHAELAIEAVAGLGDFETILGGETRQNSVLNALEYIANTGGCRRIFIHDAARPELPQEVIARLDLALDGAPGAVPVLPVVDSLSQGAEAVLGASVDRAGLYRVQTPQAFDFNAILAAHRDWPSDTTATDDAQILQAAGLSVALVAGDERLAKITFAQDMEMAAESAKKIVRTGFGYDVHRLGTGYPLWLCGIKIPYNKGLIGHSDADVGLHAITDALLGALAEGDIGDHFPPTDPKFRGASSDWFLAFARRLGAEKGAVLHHVDVTLICEAPKIAPHRLAMRQRIAEILELPLDQVSVKATTTEGTGPEGRGETIAAQAVFTLSL